jgi:hypothetical protein
MLGSRPAMTRKQVQPRISPHSVRRSCATHLLHAGVEIDTIRGWPAHVSLDTTNICAEVDLETKAKALAKCAVADARKPTKRRRDQPPRRSFCAPCSPLIMWCSEKTSRRPTRQSELDTP